MLPISTENLQLWCSMLETAQADRRKKTGETDPEIDAQLKIWYKELALRGALNAIHESAKKSELSMEEHSQN